MAREERLARCIKQGRFAVSIGVQLRAQLRDQQHREREKHDPVLEFSF